jgi:hypothetical protein
MTEALELKLKNTAACSRAAVSSVDICTDAIVSTARNKKGALHLRRMKSLDGTNELFPGFKALLETKNYVEITICCGELELVVSCLDSPMTM